MITKMVSVRDVERSLGFYVEKLGFQEEYRLEGDDGSLILAFVSLNGLVVGFKKAHNVSKIITGIDFMIYVSPETDLDQYYNSVQSSGVPVTEPLRKQYWGDRTFSLRDPDGHQPMFAQAG